MRWATDPGDPASLMYCESNCMSDYLNDPVIAGLVGVGLAILAGVINVRAVRWQWRFNGRADDRERIDELVDRFYSEEIRRPWNDLYKFVGDLALSQQGGVNKMHKLVARVRAVDRMDSDRRDVACMAAGVWARSVGALAKNVALQDKLPLRTFLATYHIMVIRHGALAEPFLLWAWQHRNHPADHTFEQVCWALALRDLAVAYNSVARQQREPVAFQTTGAERRPYVVVQPPASGLLLLSLASLIARWFRLWPWRYWLARRHVRRVMSFLMESPM